MSCLIRRGSVTRSQPIQCISPLHRIERPTLRWLWHAPGRDGGRRDRGLWQIDPVSPVNRRLTHAVGPHNAVHTGPEARRKRTQRVTALHDIDPPRRGRVAPCRSRRRRDGLCCWGRGRRVVSLGRDRCGRRWVRCGRRSGLWRGGQRGGRRRRRDGCLCRHSDKLWRARSRRLVRDPL